MRIIVTGNYLDRSNKIERWLSRGWDCPPDVKPVSCILLVAAHISDNTWFEHNKPDKKGCSVVGNWKEWDDTIPETAIKLTLSRDDFHFRCPDNIVRDSFAMFYCHTDGTAWGIW